jgi:ribosome-binding factor A
MSSHRIERVNTLIHHSLAALILRNIVEPGFNPALVTITHVLTSADLRNARVLVSINAPPEQQRAILGILKKKRGVLQHAMSAEVILKYTPHISFELDPSLAEGDHVLEMIAKLEAEHPEWPERPAEGTAGDGGPKADDGGPMTDQERGETG